MNIRDKDGLSPTMWACRLDHIHHFEILSQSENFHVEDADGIERDLIGRTWMHWSVRRLEPLECLQVKNHRKDLVSSNFNFNFKYGLCRYTCSVSL